MEALPEVTLTILFDNYNSNIDFRSSWGFSCLIEGTGRTILFDAGSKDGNLMHNFKAAGRNPCDVELIVLSHNHWDHTGGLQEFLDSRTGVDVFLPASFPDDIKDSISLVRNTGFFHAGDGGYRKCFILSTRSEPTRKQRKQVRIITE